ncbi:MAG: hypothetical protein WBB25_22485 [Sulfitobacter sp.]
MTSTLAWTPARAVYMRRALVIGLVTFVVFAALCWMSGFSEGRFLLLGLGLPLVLTLIFLLEDALRWRSLRSEKWEVDDGHLIHDGPDGRAMVPMSEIRTVATRFGNVVIRLASGQRIMMRYLPNPEGVVTQLDAARPK